MEQLSITGMGIINALGIGVEQTWEKMLQGASGVRPIDWTTHPDHEYYYEKYIKKCPVQIGCAVTEPVLCPRDEWHKDWKYLDPAIQMAVHATEQAVTDAKLESKKVAVVFGSIGSRDTFNAGTQAMYQGRTRYSPRKALNFEFGHMAATISRLFQFQGPSIMVHTACSTGLTAIDYAQKLLTCEPELDAVVVGSGDATIEPTSAFYFSSLGALSNSDSKPFDTKSDGFVMGEGAGAMVLTRYQPVGSYCTILKVAGVTVAEHETSPDADGNATIASAQKALGTTNPKDIGYINAHATGTPAGDEVEYRAMKHLFPGAVMTANKSQIGHTIGSSGIIETAYTALALRDQMTPPVRNLIEPCDTGMVLPTRTESIDTDLAIKNNFGFGGRSYSALLEKV